jgi:hypothetical protein
MTPSRGEIESRIIARAQSDDAYRARLTGGDPTGAIAEELGSPLPEGVSVRVVEEAADEVVLVLPPATVATQELSDEQLEVASGGTVRSSAPRDRVDPV